MTVFFVSCLFKGTEKAPKVTFADYSLSHLIEFARCSDSSIHMGYQMAKTIETIARVL